jgi:hypothetical protein
LRKEEIERWMSYEEAALNLWDERLVFPRLWRSGSLMFEMKLENQSLHCQDILRACDSRYLFVDTTTKDYVGAVFEAENQL